MTTSTYEIRGMHCDGCKKNAERIGNKYGKNVVADVQKWTLTVSYEWELNTASLKTDLEEMDYVLVV